MVEVAAGNVISERQTTGPDPPPYLTVFLKSRLAS